MIQRIEKGYSFSILPRVGAFVLVCYGLYNLGYITLDVWKGFSLNDNRLVIGIIFSTIGSLILFAKEYIILSQNGRYYEVVLEVLGYKIKKKNNIDKYKNLSIVTKKMQFGRLNDTVVGMSTGIKGVKGRVHLLLFLTENHLGRLQIAHFDDYNEAFELGEKIAKHTGKPLVKYNPKRLKKSKRR